MSQTNSIPFTKYHGTGNDFLAVDASEPVPDRVAFAKTHCDRESGVSAESEAAESADRSAVGPDADRPGADGVLFLELREDASPTRVEMTLVQPDGSTAAMCGNGARCVARWAYERTGETEFVIGTGAGDRGATVREDGSWVTIEMGVPAFDPEDVPLADEGPEARDDALVDEEISGLTVTAVDTGVPHAVAFVDDVTAFDLDSVAEPVRNADVFPEGANVNLAAPVADEDTVGNEETDASADAPTFDQRTFERGVEGETRSCGTGAVAIAAVARRLGLVDESTVVSRPPGGELELEVPGEGPALLSGPVTEEFSGELPADPR